MTIDVSWVTGRDCQRFVVHLQAVKRAVQRQARRACKDEPARRALAVTLALP
jgi:hypothetical protein